MVSILFEILESVLQKVNLNVNYVLQFSETDLNALGWIDNFPLFYKQILTSFNGCKLNEIVNLKA